MPKQADSRLVAGRYIYANLLCMQVCTYPAPLQGSSGSGKMQSPLLSGALQNRLTAGLYQCKHICANLLCIQVCSYPPWFWQNAGPTAQWCSATQADSRLVPVQTHLCISALYTGVQLPTALQCGTGSGKMQSPLLSGALQNRLVPVQTHLCKSALQTTVHLPTTTARQY